MPRLDASRFKIERANHHIRQLEESIAGFAKSDFYSVAVKQDLKSGQNGLVFTIKHSPSVDAALILGDALHNLRSSLDILWNEVVSFLTGQRSDDYTMFPVRKTAEKVEAAINRALKNKIIDRPAFERVWNLMFVRIQPYECGNDAVWGLHRLNIIDKHRLIIPVPHLMSVSDICLQNKETGAEERFQFILDDSGVISIKMRGNLRVKDKGHAAATVFFDVGLPYEGKAVISTLQQLAVKMNDVVEAFAATW